MAIAVSKIPLVVIATAFIACGVAELVHHHRFGHFVGYGVHTDVTLGNSDIGTHDMYYARLLNLSLRPFALEGCIFPSDVIGVPDSVLHRWDVQKRDSLSGQWLSLRGADTWVAAPFGGYWKEEPCRSAMIRLAPFQGRDVAWVYKDWVTTGEPVRMAIHTLVSKPPEKQMIVYTDAFIVKSETRPTPKQR
jgi:hypothetical protein